jgi:hypothetical protein
MNSFTSKLFVVVALAILSVGTAHSDTLANYPFTGSSRASTDGDANSSASSITDGAGLTSSIDAARGNPTPALGGISSDQIDGSTNSAAVTANDYVTFTLTPGSTVSLTTLTLDAANYTNDATFSAESFFLRSSINSFASNIGTTQSISAGSNGAFAGFSFDLSGASFQNVAAPIEFRIHFQDGISDPDRGVLLDNIVVNGTAAAVPEPATLMMLVLGGGLLVGIQRVRGKRT